MSERLTHCPACDGPDLELITAQRAIPVNSCVLLGSRDEAAEFPRGDMAFTICRGCGFCFNADHDAALSEYSARYEETQGHSPRFVEYARGLAARWVERYDLTGGHVVEIGCGSMGEFLQMMIDAGVGKGTGLDPVLNVERITHESPERFDWIVDSYDERYSNLRPDAIVCRHTLEHISAVRQFMEMLRRSIGDRTDTVLLFEMPDVRRVLEEVAFWDVYYEHCSYFSLGSLARLFRLTGFEVMNIELDYEDQYLLVEARPSTAPPMAQRPEEDDVEALVAAVGAYRSGLVAMVDRWGTELSELTAMGGRSVIWGAGSKGVSFFTNLEANDIAYAVDINPAKHGFYMAGTGQQIVAPEFLVDYDPDLVVLMNPVYVDEVQADLDRLGVKARLIAV